MKIEKIEKKGNKYKLVLDNKTKIDTYDDVILNHHLLFDKEVDSDLINAINIDNLYYDAYYKTINYITRKLRSLKEIDTFLDKYQVSSDNKDKIIEHLTKIGLINDNNFAKAYINDKLYLSNDGPNKIRKVLLEHNIDSNVIDNILDSLKDEFNDKLQKLIDKKIKSNTKYGGYYLKQKISNELVNLGFDYSNINALYDDSKVNYDYEAEYDKMYKKLSKKYSGELLDKMVKQKLYQKGIKEHF